MKVWHQTLPICPITSNTLTWSVRRVSNCRPHCQRSDSGDNIACLLCSKVSSLSFVSLLVLLRFLPQSEWWSNIRTRPDQTASTLWTTSWSCTTRRTTLTTGASSAVSARNLRIVCLDSVCVECTYRTADNAPWCHQHCDPAPDAPNWKWPSLREVPGFHRLCATCGFGQKSSCFRLQNGNMKRNGLFWNHPPFNKMLFSPASNL